MPQNPLAAQDLPAKTAARLISVDPEDPRALALMASLNEALTQISGDSGRSSFDPAQVRQPGAAFVLALADDGEPLGCAALRPLAAADASADGGAEGIVELKRMFARPGTAGVGGALLRHMEALASRLGHRELWLETRRINLRAVAFYRRHGFAEIANFGSYAQRADAICLGKALPRAASEMEIEQLTTIDDATRAALSDLLIDSVAHGASIGFMHPLADAEADRYWQGVAASLGSQHQLWLLREGQALLGTVQLDRCGKPNGRHRGEIQKLFVHSRARGRGLASLLMAEAERFAAAQGISLLVLDTESGSKAEQVYRHLGWQHAGNIPDFARSPHGTLHPTALYFKLLRAPCP
ncbi:GNAT family N-acetyltransferase [Paucibacter sp. APW11]|uniref:GNAT family N-acetyltransferase n=1 Tax=Roseateles aquae TaxID=3077235 RepID=A0ABU3PIH3_9BURK|nr:GNAT family N-acetyltransferase [Paucibacter sp. APW11]MDT9002365.1 GNAT family N-acetyltransferase [Paucibacter sp. APW11]